MAKKTTPAPSRAKSGSKAKPEPVAAPPAAAAKPRARAKSPKKTAEASDEIVVAALTEVTVVSDEVGPSDEDIRNRAYHRYLERGGGHGMDFEDWLEAERELRQRK